MLGCTSTTQQESTGQFIDSSAVTLKIKSSLMADESVKSLAISVKTYKGVVQLSGFVDNPEQKQRAIDIARNVQGVKSVVDALVVKIR
jgi:osmotically-inducible protein OsmY